MENLSGDENYSRGLKCLKTGLFQWSKDYASAAFHFDEAVKCYRATKQFDKAIITLNKNVEVNEKLHDNWACARNLETVLSIYMDNMPMVEGSQIIEATQKASMYFKSADSAQNSIQLFHKVAKFLNKERKLVKEAVQLLEEALRDIDEFNQTHLRGDIFSTYISILVDAQMYDEAVNSIKVEIERNKANPKNPPYILVLSVLALLIIKKETITAEDFLSKCFSEVPGFIKTRERETCEKLLDTYNEGDQEGFDDICNRPIVNTIFPLNIVKALKKVRVKQVVAKKIENQEQINPEQVKADEDDFKKSLL